MPFLGKRLLAVIGLVVTFCSACTTKFSAATDAHSKGSFAEASDHAEKLCPSIRDGEELKGLKVSYERDRLWVGLEKGTILADAGKCRESLELLEYVDKEAQDLRTIESWYLENPLDVKSWDAGQFAEDVGQAVVGADQTTYLLQPYEMILAKTYLCLQSVLCEADGADAFAKGAAELQQFEKLDLERAGHEVVQPPVERMDSLVRGQVPPGKSTDFSVGGVLSLGEFGAAKDSMRAAIDAAKASRSADPRVAFSTVVQWAAYMKSKPDRAANTARGLAQECGDKGLVDEMVRLSSAGSKEQWVLVLVEAGFGPSRGHFNVRFPIVIPGVGTAWFRGVYPYLKFRAEGRPEAVTVVADGKEFPVAAVTSIDAIAARNFQRREAELWWGPTIRASVRAIAALVAQAAQDDDSNATKLLIALGGALVAEAEQPDLRAWTTLPASQHAAIVRRPADGIVRIRLASGASPGEIAVPVPDGGSMVHVRALNAQAYVARAVSLVSPSPSSAAVGEGK